MEIAVTTAGLVAAGFAGVRWLRVAQREHYVPGSVTRFAGRWWGRDPNWVLAAQVVLCVLFSPVILPLGISAALGVAVGPFGLGLRGRTSKLAWTRRMRTLAGAWALLHLLLLALGFEFGLAPFISVLAAALTPVLVDWALFLTAPLERRMVQPFVRRAAARLEQVHPTVVAITGSYGKTSTKGYVAHLVEAARSVVASPASFNNRAGLARAVNEQLLPGTEVFVAEMGTYGKGEIAELCAWCRPEIAVITAVGPVHLERMGSEEAIVEAKAEILEGARVAVLNVDHPLLEALAGRRAEAGQKVVRCSATSAGSGVAVVGGEVSVAGRPVGRLANSDAPPTNVACAVAVALELGVPEDVVAARLASLPTARHRLSVTTGSSGAVVVDDTYNANPAGAARALAVLAAHSSSEAKRVVVTPGMVELGRRQYGENASFGAAAAAMASHVVVVGATNRRALLAGTARGTAEVVVVGKRDQAVAWVRENVGDGDAVLYENDLPDHFP
jgi:UDP-N-acetylmuramoyl-tripeptide--D-alanyl-D-alanine ligase